jgi:hypothetical protein
LPSFRSVLCLCGWMGVPLCSLAAGPSQTVCYSNVRFLSWLPSDSFLPEELLISLHPLLLSCRVSYFVRYWVISLLGNK